MPGPAGIPIIPTPIIYFASYGGDYHLRSWDIEFRQMIERRIDGAAGVEMLALRCAVGPEGIAVADPLEFTR